jgi:hypothetical protein
MKLRSSLGALAVAALLAAVPSGVVLADQGKPDAVVMVFLCVGGSSATLTELERPSDPGTPGVLQYLLAPACRSSFFGVELQ